MVVAPAMAASMDSKRSQTSGESSTRKTRTMAPSVPPGSGGHYRPGMKSAIGGRLGGVGIFLRLIVEQSVLHGVAHQLGGARHRHLLENPGLVGADGFHRNVQPRGDLGDAAAGGELPDNHDLAVVVRRVRRRIVGARV